MLVAQNSLGPVCPVPLTVRGMRGSSRFVHDADETHLSAAATGARIIDRMMRVRAMRNWTTTAFQRLSQAWRW